MSTPESALVLGATGGIGGEVARQLLRAGWVVKALKRPPLDRTRLDPQIHWIEGDAMDRGAVMRASEGCTVIVHAVNPPGYRDWDRLVLPMIDNTISAAIARRATVVLPGTVYNYGPDAFPVLQESSPQRPTTRKGAIRVELEARLMRSTEAGARVIIVRAGDFFGPETGNSFFSQGMVKRGKPVKTVLDPGRLGVGHQWAYLPDVARTMVELLRQRARLEPFAAFHTAGHWDSDGTRMAASIASVVELRTGFRPRVARFPWQLLMLASPFVTTLREMREMRYLWQVPVRMDNQKLLSVLGEEPHTPLMQAIEMSLVGMGSLKRFETA